MNPKILMLAGAITLGGTQTPVSHLNRPQSVSGAIEAKSQTVTSTHKPLTENDYVQPLENWLKKQGSPLRGYDFYSVGKQYGIDPDLLIAITKAETNLARVVQRGVPCNVGSVGSFDSTATTFGCASYREGIEQIAKTLNNPLLGQYQNIGQLSRKYNKTGHVYASSPENWSNNVIATLSALKGYPVPPDYQFRRN